ncbi:MAG: DUF3800 domain-containing protein [Thermoplasmatales archaeon]|nr:DUF3800 domain-containing protein [Thermoplasmatales archaeon]
MHITYIDESGQPDFLHQEQEFVLVSLTIEETFWKNIDDRVNAIKRNYFPDRDERDVEFHAMDFFNRHGPFRYIGLETRLEIFREVLKLVAESDCVIIAVLVRKDELTDEDLDVVSLAFEPLFDSLCLHMERVNCTAKENGKEEHGCILVLDSVSRNYDDKVRTVIKTLLKNGTEQNKNEYLIEDPFFVDSRHRNMIQLVDCVAYCIRRKFRKAVASPASQETFEEFFSIIEPKFLEVEGDAIGYGLKKIP